MMPATLFITTSPSLRSLGSNRSRTLLHVLLSKLPNPVMPLPTSGLCTGYKLLSLTYKVLTTTQPLYLHNLITVQPPRITCSSSLVTLARPSTSSCLRITDRSFQHASPRLWNQLSASLRQPRTNLSNSAWPSSLSGTNYSISSIYSPLSSPISPSHLHSFTPRLKPSSSANPSHRSLPFLFPDWLHGFPGMFTDTSEHIRFYFLVFLFSTF